MHGDIQAFQATRDLVRLGLQGTHVFGELAAFHGGAFHLGSDLRTGQQTLEAAVYKVYNSPGVSCTLSKYAGPSFIISLIGHLRSSPLLRS